MTLKFVSNIHPKCSYEASEKKLEYINAELQKKSILRSKVAKQLQLRESASKARSRVQLKFDHGHGSWAALCPECVPYLACSSPNPFLKSHCELYQMCSYECSVLQKTNVFQTKATRPRFPRPARRTRTSRWSWWSTERIPDRSSSSFVVVASSDLCQCLKLQNSSEKLSLSMSLVTFPTFSYGSKGPKNLYEGRHVGCQNV